MLLSGQPDAECIPGRQLSCVCPDNTQGIKTCLDGGRGFGPCRCSDSLGEYDESAEYEEAAPPGTVTKQPKRRKRRVRARTRRRRIPYEEGMLIPDGYELRTRPRWAMLAPGMAVALGFWAFSAFIALVIDGTDPNETEHRFLYIPVLGPFLLAGTVEDGTARMFAIMDGILQAAGATVAIWGAFIPQKYLLLTSRSLTIKPLVGPGAVGLEARF